jgi:hypothetical protein
MYQALQRITGSRLWALISPRDMLSVIGDAAFRIPARGRCRCGRRCSP